MLALAAALAALPRVARAEPGGEPALPVSARVELSSGGKPVGVLMHDFDGDGRATLVAATLDPGSLCFWSDPLAPPVVVPVPDYPIGPELLRLETIDAVAIASRSSEEMLVYAPEAEDPARPLHRIPLGARPHALGAGPLLSVEQPSVVIATLSDELVVIDHRGVARFPLLEGLPTFVAVEPGRVLVGSQEDPGVRAYRLTPEGGLQPEEARLALPGIPRDYLRFAGADSPESWVAGGDRWLWRTGRLEGGAARLREKRVGTIPLQLEPLTRPEPGATASSDIAALSTRDLSYTVLDGRARVLHGGPAGQDPWGIACGDLDGDGAVDLAFANRGARRVSVLLGRGDGTFHEADRVAAGRGPHALAAADLDGDGNREVLAIAAMDQELRVFAPQVDGGDGGELTLVQRTSAAPAGDALATADVDGDGHVDVGFLVRAADGARLRILFGDGTGRVHARDAAPDLACAASVGDLWLGDLDGDGSIDGLVADPAVGQVHLLGAAPHGLRVVSSLSVPTSPAALCVDGGRIWVALGSPGPRLGLAELAVAGGAGALRLAERAFVDVGLPVEDVALLADANDTGGARLALLARPEAGDGAGWLITLEQVAGVWRESARERTGLRPYALDAGDLDGDGRADVVVGAQNSHHVNLWRGTPQGLARLPDLGAGRGVLDVLLTPLEAGGGMRVVVANAFSNDLSLIRPR